MNTSSSKLLPHLALWTFFLTVIPILFLVAYIGEINCTLTSFSINAVTLLIGAYLGYFQAKFKYYILRKNGLSIIGKYLLLIVTYLLSFGLPFTYALLIYKDYIGLIVCWYILFLIFYGKFYKSYGLHYTEIISWEICIVAAFIDLGAMIAQNYSFISLLFVAVIALYIFLHNQANLDEMLERSRKNTPMITNIRRNNTKWLCLVMSFIFIVYPLRKLIGNILLTIIKVFILLIGYILNFISSLMPRGDDLATQTRENTDVITQLVGESTTSHLWEVIFWCIIISLIILLRKYIIACLLDIIKLIKRLFIKLYGILFGLKEVTKPPNLFYDETIEEVSFTTTLQSKAPSLNKNRWKKQLKEFLKLPNNEAKYRFGFKLLLEGFKLQGLTFKASHTPKELANLAKDQSHLPSIDSVTYERIRYGEKSLEKGNLEELENTLVTLIKK